MESPAFSVLGPWIPPELPDLARLAMEAADAAGIWHLRDWPSLRKSGVAFGGLPPFLAWRGLVAGRHHLVLVQAREAGALVPGARPADLPAGWLDRLELEDLARPLAAHPDFPGGAAVHVVRLAAPGRAQVRTRGEAEPELVRAVLERLTGLAAWVWL